MGINLIINTTKEIKMDNYLELQQLHNKYQHCKRCSELCKSRTQVVFGSGNPNAEILFIGEAPGANEDKLGIPFCGMSGKVLEELLQSINLSRNDVFITNTILCRPENNRNPYPEEVENCRDRLDQLIAIMRPKVIVTIGNFSTQRILNKTGIKTVRGKIFSTTINNHIITVIPVIHPANYLYSGRNPELLTQMKQDFQTIASVIKERQEQKNLNQY